MSVPQKHILIVDDHALFADGLALILKHSGLGIHVSVSNSPHRLLADLGKLQVYDLILVDLHMPSLTGFNLLHAIKLQSVPVRVAVISGTGEKSDIEQSLSMGACGFIPKDTASLEMLDAITRLLDDQRYLPSQFLGDVDWIEHETIGAETTSAITERQQQVLALISQGLQNKQIALVMGVSVSAVKGHIEQIFRTLGVNNRTACVQRAREKGII